MSIKIRKDGQVGELILPADSIQVLDIEGRFNSKNLEDVLKEVDSGTEENMTRIENKVEQLSNPNLLINGDFQVWTRGTEFTDPREYNGECANRWFWNYSVVQGSKINKVDGGLKITYLKDCTTALIYKMSFEDKKSLLGKQLTVSFELNGTKYQKSFTLKNLRESLVFETDFKIHTGYNEDSNDVVYLNPTRKQGVELIVKDVKLEIGSKVTPFDHKPYSVELENSIKYDVNGNYKSTHSNPNLLINGDFQVWQRGTSFSATNKTLYHADRWVITSRKHNITQLSDKGGLRMTKSEIDDTGWFIRQRIPKEEYSKLLGCKVTLSCKFKTDGNQQGFEIYDRQNKTVVANSKYNTTMQEGIMSHTFQFEYDGNSEYLEISFIGGSNNDNSATYYEIEWMKMECGELATPFVPRPYAEELALCQRYYISLPGGRKRADYITSNFLEFHFNFCMRISPTFNTNSDVSLVRKLDNTQVSGFTNSIQYTPTYIGIRCTKASHGLTDGHLCFNESSLDAEIY